jgi:mono/diheme cytochrome c family protein
MSRNNNLTIRESFFGITSSVILLLFLTGQNAEAQSKPWPVPTIAASMKNPVPSDPVTIKDGKVLYASYCSPCHGDKGKGDGPAATALSPKPADHTSAKVQNESDGTLFYMISEGRDPMPQEKKILSENQRWVLVDYIRTLSKTGKK